REGCPASSRGQRTRMSRASPWPPSGDRSKTVMVGLIGGLLLRESQPAAAKVMVASVVTPYRRTAGAEFDRQVDRAAAAPRAASSRSTGRQQVATSEARQIGWENGAPARCPSGSARGAAEVTCRVRNMIGLETLLAFLAAAFVVISIPGPTILLVMGYAVGSGLRIALLSIAGVCLGDLAAMAVTFA